MPSGGDRTLSFLRYKVSDSGFVGGANLPWLHYGGDFGANAWERQGGVGRPERNARLRSALADLAERGFRSLRWFLLCDGRAGLRVAEDQTPLGLDDRVFSDVEAALEAAEAHQIEILFTLIDFLWFSRPRLLNAVQMGGRRDIVRDRGKREAFFDRVFQPMLERLGREPAIRAWDIVNEPEWATRGLGTEDRSTSVSRSTMRDFIRQAVERVHRTSSQQATVGLASARGLPLVRGLGLDFYQIHWYDAVEERAPLDRPVASLGLDRPVLLGEFPTRGSRRSPTMIVDSARRNGFAGALGWSVLAGDETSDYEALAEIAPVTSLPAVRRRTSPRESRR